jgi:hypothetical protein
MEMTLSIFAWLGVILLQAMVHFYIKARKRLSRVEEPPPLEASPLVLESLAQLHADHSSRICNCAVADDSFQKDDNLSVAKTESIQSIDSLDEYDSNLHDALCWDDSDDLSIDGDEPQMFFVLLSQTGSEMMKVSESLSFLVARWLL